MHIYRVTNGLEGCNFSKADVIAMKELGLIEFDKIKSYESVVVHLYRKAQS